MFTPRTLATGMAFPRDLRARPTFLPRGLPDIIIRCGKHARWVYAKAATGLGNRRFCRHSATWLFRRDPAAGERHLDQGAGVDRAPDLEAGAIGLGQGLGEGKAEAGAARTPARRSRELAERLHRHRDVLLAHADAGAADAQHPLAVRAARRRDDHPSADAGGLGRV